MLAPFVPHITEELWERLGGTEGSVHAQNWPAYDEEAMKVAEVEVMLQINGKGRERVIVPSEATKEELEAFALADPKIKELIGDSEIVRVVCVPKRLVNIVIRQ